MGFCFLIPAILLFSALNGFSATENLNARLESVRKEHKLPALAAAFIKDGRIIGIGAVGVRKHSDETPVLLDDKFHQGSLTKSMTATLAGMLVDEKKLAWNTTLESFFPDMKEMHPGYKKVTLEQLLGNRGGAPDYGKILRDEKWKPLWRHKGSLQEQRRHFTEKLTASAPEVPPGTKYLYSNAGFVFAGHMVEKASGKPWEAFIKEKLFSPLEMKSADFGAPGTKGKIDQPWGHVEKDGEIVPVDHHDNYALIGPAGTVHCSIEDLAKYALFHLQASSGKGTMLKPDTFTKLYTPLPDQTYALGWNVAKRGWAKGKVLNHTGSNTMFYSVLWIAPHANVAIAVCSNIGSTRGEKGTDAAAAMMITHFLSGN